MLRSCVPFLALLVLVAPRPQEQADAPRVDVLVPGITVSRLPVRLNNINSLAYTPDGRLFAAGYDGRVHVLTDADGDGLEERAAVYWDKKGDLLTPVGILMSEEGLYVAARGKIALLRDTDADGRANVSETVVAGWARENYNSANRNDASGLALDAEGNLYFSLGCSDYRNAFLLDKQGKSRYSLESERGTVLKVSPDRKRREIVCTGVRFVIGLAFNRHGDLFATDQEGDTWFPGGNPRDELLHIIPGRHYGFPFRHPEHLPDVVDEPYVVGFSPQHQSSCGFRFNETRPGRKRFGPASWEGDALVTGFSRGKLWRVPLARTKSGYVGRQVLIASFAALPTDVAISPAGDLVVTSHSGRPDWGSGPGGQGHLYKLVFDRKAPQPIAAWPSGPMEVKIAFDRPIEPDRLGKASIEAGDFVWEGDRHERIWPGYKVVKEEKRGTRLSHPVVGTRVSADRRTVVLSTAAHPWRTRYAVTLPGVAGSTVDLSYELTGVEAEWIPEGEQRPGWRGWIPHLDSTAARSLTRGSSEHDRLWELLDRPGRLVLRTRLKDPDGKAVMTFAATDSFRVSRGSDNLSSIPEKGRHRATFPITARKKPVDLRVEMKTGGKADLDVSIQSAGDPHSRPLRLEQHLLPWAPVFRIPQPGKEAGIGMRITGNPARGRALFYGSEAKCSTCHVARPGGERLAADLTVSAGRDPAAVLRDIVQPSAAINPDFVSYVVRLKNGDVISGLLRSVEDDRISLVDADAKRHDIPRTDIDEFRASTVSLMPEGYAKLGEEKLRDLVAFLCLEDPGRKAKGLSTGAILREYWLDIPGSGVEDLTRHPDFPSKPAGSVLIKQFEGPMNWRENYGSRIRGYVHPPSTGDYVFWIAGDDNCELWLSPDDKASRKTRIARVKTWSRSRDWGADPAQKSKPIRLEAGRRYYIEALQKEGAVDDGVAVGWRLPDGTLERPIPGARLSSPDK